jgi:chromate reductase
LVFVNVPVMPQPEAYVGGAAQLFDAGGKLTNDGTREVLRRFMAAFAAWIDANARAAGSEWPATPGAAVPA